MNTFIPTHRDTQELITTELSHGFIPKPLSHQHICIGEGFRRLLRQLMQSENWQTIIQTCCRERFNLMDSIVQSLVNKTLTGHVEVSGGIAFQMPGYVVIIGVVSRPGGSEACPYATNALSRVSIPDTYGCHAVIIPV